jgi:glutaredoxin-like YruB-family protein
MQTPLQSITRILTIALFSAVTLTVFTAPLAAQQTTLTPATVKKSAYPKIVIYTVAWCPHCKQLKEYLTSNNIPFMNKDVEVDAAAMEELTTKYKSTGVPVVVFGKDQEILKGFTPENFEKAVAKVLAADKK